MEQEIFKVVIVIIMDPTMRNFILSFLRCFAEHFQNFLKKNKNDSDNIVINNSRNSKVTIIKNTYNITLPIIPNNNDNYTSGVWLSTTLTKILYNLSGVAI